MQYTLAVPDLEQGHMHRIFRPEPVAHLLPLRQQLIEDRRVCGGSTVQKHDGTRMDAPEKLFECFLLCGLFVLIPVHIGETPEEGLIAESFCHLKIRFAVLSLGPVLDTICCQD